MKYSRNAKIFVGIATLLMALFPFLVLLMAFLPIFLTFPAMLNNVEPDPTFLAPMFLIFPVMICFSFLFLGMQVFYVIEIIKNRKGSELIRILVAIGLYLLPYFAMPIYFFIYILPETPPDWALETS
jgi:hypothetical protein